MQYKKIIITNVALLFAGSAVNGQVNKNNISPKPPNFVIIFIDDMGYGDIGPFGSRTNDTPHLNRMAEEGMRFTSFYSAGSVCTPSRAALMTGCYPKRVGLAKGTYRNVLFPKDSHGLNPKEVTIADILKQKHYKTACFGKWHLGDQPPFLPTKHGFDTFLGIPYSNDMWPHSPGAKGWRNFPPPLPVVKNEKVIDIVKNMDDQALLCKLFTDATTDFIKKNRDNPFFVYLPHAFIHQPRNSRKEFMDKAGEAKDMDELKMRTTNGYQTAQRTKAQIEEVDWSVGEILKTIRELGLEKNTMVLFTSDNGGSQGCSNAPLRGGKGTTWEGGMREPAIFWWPGTIPANTSCDEITSSMDVMPTIAKLAGGEIPKDRKIDGKNIGPLLIGEKGAKTLYKAFFYYKEDKMEAVRSGEWKLTIRGLLYNLKNDIGEQHDVAKDNLEVVEQLSRYIAEMKNDLDKLENCRPPGIVENPRYLEMEHK
jgi:arylsulfatase A-like enzyme